MYPTTHLRAPLRRYPGLGAGGSTAPTLTTDASGNLVIDASNVTVNASTVSQLQSIGNNPSAWLSSQEVPLAYAMMATIPVLGWITEGIIAAVGWASGGGGLCADGQPHTDAFGSWESNLGAYPIHPIGQNDFDAAAYATMRVDYDTGLQCKFAGQPPVPLGEVFGQLLAAYNKANPGPPIKHSRLFRVYEGGWQGKSTGTRGLSPVVPDPVSMGILDLWSSQHPGGVPDADPTLPPVGSVVTVYYSANDRPKAPSGGSLPGSTATLNSTSSTAATVATGVAIAAAAGAAALGVYALATKQSYKGAAKTVWGKVKTPFRHRGRIGT